jgi:hypothetical protein
LRSDYEEKRIITSPGVVVQQNYRLSGNYYFSLIVSEEGMELCFPICSESPLFCFRVTGFISEKDFRGRGWIEILSKERDAEIVIPPYAQGFFVGKKIESKLKVEGYSKIFWEVPSTVDSLQTNWSEVPVFYSQFRGCTPSIGFKVNEDGCYVGIGDSPERAILSSIHLSRIGKDNLKNITREFLLNFKDTGDKVVRDNVFLSLFYSNSLCVDSDDNSIMASKSPKYYVSGGFWARDFIFWTFPIIERYDPARARELVSLVLTKYWRHKGIHALYLDGRILYEGFELDELSYYFLILERGIHYGVLKPESSLEMASELIDIIYTRKHEKYNLFSTELNSSDDPAVYPYITFDNVALWYSLRVYSSKIKRSIGYKLYSDLSEKIRNDIMLKLVKDGMFCYSSDLNGNYEFYDDPTGSLLLLPYLGFIDRDSPVFRNTVKWIISNHNIFMVKGRFSGLGNRHVKHPWVHWFATEVLSGLRDPSTLTEIPMDDGICCETIDEESGKCVTGIHFPGSSGFFAQAIISRIKKNRISEA